MSLAIPETAILAIAKQLPANVIPDTSNAFVVPESNNECELSYWNLARGILPSLQYVTERDSKALKWNHVPVADLPDTYPNSSGISINPFSNNYFCHICSHELANTYFHCQGCEKILLKNFNICIKCFQEDAYRVNMEMNPNKVQPIASHIHHFGTPQDRCSHVSTECSECSVCGKCALGTCKCHQTFERRCRFYTVERQQAIVEHCVRVVEGNTIKYSVETEHASFTEIDCASTYSGEAPGEVEDDMVFMNFLTEAEAEDNTMMSADSVGGGQPLLTTTEEFDADFPANGPVMALPLDNMTDVTFREMIKAQSNECIMTNNKLSRHFWGVLKKKNEAKTQIIEETRKLMKKTREIARRKQSRADKARKAYGLTMTMAESLKKLEDDAFCQEIKSQHACYIVSAKINASDGTNHIALSVLFWKVWKSTFPDRLRIIEDTRLQLRKSSGMASKKAKC